MLHLSACALLHAEISHSGKTEDKFEQYYLRATSINNEASTRTPSQAVPSKTERVFLHIAKSITLLLNSVVKDFLWHLVRVRRDHDRK